MIVIESAARLSRNRRGISAMNCLRWWAHLDSIRSREATEDSKRPKGAQLTRDQMG